MPSIAPRTLKRTVLVLLLAIPVAGGVAMKATGQFWRVKQVVSGILAHFAPPNVRWQTAAPTTEGLNPTALNSMRDGLAKRGTTALLVIRGGRLVYEWYSILSGPNQRHYTAALAKAVIGSMVLQADLTAGHLRLNDPAWKYIPQWKSDPVRSRIRIRDLAFHTSGIADVDFFSGEAGKLKGWKADYYNHPGARFNLAIDQVPILFPPGTRYRYSGIGYYALADAITASLRDGADRDIRSLYRDRVMRPLGIPEAAWQLSYGTAYHADGMTLYACGSGGSVTARAEARIGELLLKHGQWNGRTVLNPYWVREMLSGTRALPYTPDPNGKPQPVPSGGWWLNTTDAWPALPRDAIAGEGAGDQIVLIIPSLDMVVVRQGSALAQQKDQDADHFWATTSRWIFQPLMRAVVGPSTEGNGTTVQSATAPLHLPE
ncbi:MAG: serine hydrolase domain-containing protein [Gammaproteobacteria bacterium]|nr:serine hydrolase [Gammaproteobacteria bacterium]